jgi:hypothetical protein
MKNVNLSIFRIISFLIGCIIVLYPIAASESAKYSILVTEPIMIHPLRPTVELNGIFSINIMLLNTSNVALNYTYLMYRDFELVSSTDKNGTNIYDYDSDQERILSTRTIGMIKIGQSIEFVTKATTCSIDQIKRVFFFFNQTTDGAAEVQIEYNVIDPGEIDCGEKLHEQPYNMFSSQTSIILIIALVLAFFIQTVRWIARLKK